MLRESDMIDPILLSLLADPVDKSKLQVVGAELVSPAGRRYPIVDGVPVLLVQGIDQTIGVANETLRLAKGGGGTADPLWLQTTGMGDSKIAELRSRLQTENFDGQIDPVVSYLVGATNGNLYEHLAGKLQNYPIPSFPMPVEKASQKTLQLVDIGCSWGRWSIAAARAGYSVVGIDPSLGAVLAARRVATGMGLKINWIVGDARHLPFCAEVFDRVFSYSVIQHFARNDAKLALTEVGRILAPDGSSMIQMPNMYGIRSLYHLSRRRFAEGTGFNVRYYKPDELLALFAHTIGPSRLSVDGFFGLGLQGGDRRFMPLKYRLVLSASHVLRNLVPYVRSLINLADSLYVTSEKMRPKQPGG
jgi:2-polyprenyl-3-methyl-5-hydroxy-6-metoxy-1,4-benzoquinol methylase/uncharacterized protein YbaR (Trm112 family)